VARPSPFSSTREAGRCSYVEDCSVCCRPIELSVDETENGDFSIVAVRGDE